jgi:short-subunit dehydrogenase
VRIEGKTALLTGATGGIGRSIAGAFAERGANLILSARQQEALERLAAELPGEHRTLPADFAEPGAVEKVAAEAADAEIAVANAGLSGTGRFESFTDDQLQRVLRVNLETPVRLAHALVPAMVERGEGHLAFIASISGKYASPLSALYNASKFGLRGFALGLREELHGTGVGVSLVSPGAISGAGIFAESGASVPRIVGPTPVEKVGAAVVKAIERDRVEIVVAPPVARLLANAAMLTPGLSGRLSRRSATKVAERIGRSQLAKR